MTPLADMVTVRMARLGEFWSQFLPLHQVHYIEAEPYRRHDFRPDYPGYLTLDQFGHLPIAAALVPDPDLSQGHLVGYLMCTVANDLHHVDEDVAHEAGVYILPGYRCLTVLRRLYDTMEEHLRAAGVRTVYMTSREISGGAPLGRYLRRRGYQPLCETWVKQLQAE